MYKKRAEAGDKVSANQIPATEDKVRLPPLLGLRPGIYLAIMYGAALMLIFFFILIYPGLRRPGSVVILKTEPAGAALRVDGVYMGTSPEHVFVSKGPHTMELTLPGFDVERIECEIPGQLFASAFFPRRYPLEAVLHTADPAAVFARSAADYAAWTFGGEPTASWQIPLSLSEGAYRIGAASGSASTAELIKASARFAATRSALRDLIRAKALSGNGGLSPSPLTLVRSTADIIGFLSENPGAAVWLADALPPESAALVVNSAWYQKQLAAFAGLTAAETLAPPPEALSPETYPAETLPPFRQIRAGGLLFTGIAAGTLVQGQPFPHRIPLDAFMICNTEVPSPAFADFLDANPQWKPDRREALIEQQLVTGEYLNSDWSAGGLPAGNIGTINAVSWFAAEAFCEWLSGRLPPSMNNYEVRLPSEAEWEYAAKSVQKWGGAQDSIVAMQGGSWEWCADAFAPLPQFTAAPEAIAATGSPERSVRGGSWLNSAGSAGPETRASLPPETCSPFVSFRPVIARKKTALTGPSGP